MPTRTLDKQQPATLMSAAALVVALVAVMVGPINLVGADVEGGETCSPVAYRALDTRLPAPGVKLGPGDTRNATVAGVGGIPADAKTVKVQLTATRQEGGDAFPGQTILESFLTAYPEGTTRPGTSNLNPVVGHTSANGAQTVAVGTGGMITIYNNAGSTHVIVDVQEWCDDHTHDHTHPASQSFALTARNALTFVGAADAVVVSVAVTAPVAGQVTINSTTNVGDFNPGENVVCSITTGTTIDVDYRQAWTSPGDPGAASQLAGTRMFDIAADTTVTYNLVCLGTSGFAGLADSVLTAIFTPTRTS